MRSWRGRAEDAHVANLTPEELEANVMAHRYLYYVCCTPVLQDYDYDALERVACSRLPETSPVHKPGSDLERSYSAEHVALAKRLRGRP